MNIAGARRARITSVVIAAQHNPDVSADKMKKDIIKYVVQPVIPSELLDADTQVLCERDRAVLSLAGLSRTLVSLDARFWLIPTAVSPGTAAAPSPEKIRPR